MSGWKSERTEAAVAPGYVALHRPARSAVLQPALGRLGKLAARAEAPRYAGRPSPRHAVVEHAGSGKDSRPDHRTCSHERPLAFLLLAFVLLLGACARHDTPASSQVLRISQRNEPGTLDPAIAGFPDEFFIIRALSEGLLTPAPEGGPPRLAAAENFDISADGLTYTFQLHAAARWSNGDPVTADDFIASYRRVLTPATAAPKADLFFAVKNARAFATGALTDFAAVGFRAPDARTLVITLENPSPRFLLYVASGPWIPVNPRVVAQHGRKWTEPGNFVGNGPFTLAEWRSQQRIVLKKNPAYHVPNAVKLDEIQFLRFDSGDTEERAFRAGQIDVTMAVPPSKLATYARERPPRLRRTLLAETRYLSFNTTRPPLNDVRIRLALAFSIDRQKIVDRVLMGGQLPAGRFLPPALRAARDTATLPTQQEFDPVEARRLLAQAGFAGGKNFPKLELTGWTGTPVLEAVQEMWRHELGIEFGIAVREANVHLAALRAGAYDIAFVTTLLDVTDAMALLGDFVGQAPNNLPHWQAGGYDELLARAAARPDLPRQVEDLLAAEALLLERAPVAPLYFNTRNWLMSPRVHGWQDDALWTRYYTGVWLSGK